MLEVSINFPNMLTTLTTKPELTGKRHGNTIALQQFLDIANSINCTYYSVYNNDTFEINVSI